MRISDWSSDVCSSDLAALWLLAGLWATLRGIAMQRRSAFVAGQAERLASLVEASPQLPVIVRADWRIEASERLGRWLGLETTSGRARPRSAPTAPRKIGRAHA